MNFKRRTCKIVFVLGFMTQVLAQSHWDRQTGDHFNQQQGAYQLPQLRQYQHHQQYQQQQSPRAPFSGWGEWSGWSRCSRSCGGGVQEQIRNCRHLPNRPSNGVVLWSCTGANKKYRWCNAKPCPDGSSNSRLSLCRAFNRPYGIPNVTRYTWIPWNRGGPCQLSCKAKGHRLFYQQSARLTDGTDCSYMAPAPATDEFDLLTAPTPRHRVRYDRHICVEGRCVDVGCDNVVSSKAVPDICGVCNGDNSTCTFHQGRFRQQYNMEFGYIKIVDLPRGARNVNITELTSTRNYLALRTPAGPFHINGRASTGFFDRSGTYSVNGVAFKYTRPYPGPAGESILIRGPIAAPLEVLMFHQEQNPGIHYEFVVPKTRPVAEVVEGDGATGQQVHQLGPYSSHEVYSQGGVPKIRPVQPAVPYQGNQPMESGGITLRREDGVYTQIPYSASSSSANDPTASSASKESDKKRNVVVHRQEGELSHHVHWEDRGYGQCSQTCAAGIQVSIIHCILNSTGEKVDEFHCMGDKPRPRVKICNRKACPPYYFAGPWSPCTKTCGYGRRTRSVTCRQEFAGNFMTTVSHRKCRDLPRLATHERCQAQECARWKVIGDWSECTASCGAGKKQRQVVCVTGDDEVVPDNQCPTSARPLHVKSCSSGPCITRWFLSEWDECSADCNRGFQRRNVFCVNTANRPNGCSRPHRPNATRSCARASCGLTYEWFATASWGPCSTKCGRGFQQRRVVCLSVRPDGTMSLVEQAEGDDDFPCSLAEKPAIQQACNTRECDSKWHFTPWMECSKSCDGGRRNRMVQCLDAEGRFSSECDKKTKPVHTEMCNTTPCDSYQNSTCVDSDVGRCRLIMKSRFCSYKIYYEKRCCRTCSIARNQSMSVRGVRRNLRNNRADNSRKTIAAAARHHSPPSTST